MDGRDYLLVRADEGQELVEKTGPNLPREEQSAVSSHRFRSNQYLPLERQCHETCQVNE